ARYARNYLHQKPLLSPDLKINLEAIKNDKRPLLGPYWFAKLGRILKAESTDTSVPERDPQDPERVVWKDSLQKFYDLFSQGEAITIADTFLVGAQSMVPIQDLIKTQVLGSLFGISPQASAQQAIIKKTRIERTKVQAADGSEKDGIRIDVYSLPPRSFEVGVNVSWFASLLKLSTGWQGGNGVAFSYIIADPQTKADRQYLAARLYPILYFNSTELLAGTDTELRNRQLKYTPHRLDAKVSARSTSIDTLYHQRFQTKAVQVLKYQPPAPTPEAITPTTPDFDPAKRELNFWVHSDRLESGNNFTSFLLSFIPKFQLGAAADNPANNFLGDTRGTTVTTEVEFTLNREALPQTSVETHVRGTRISNKDLVNLLHEASRRLGPIGEQYRLRQEATAEFANTQALYLFAASEVLNLKYEGLNKLRAVLRIPPAKSTTSPADPGQVLKNLLMIEGSMRGGARPPKPTGFRASLASFFGLTETQPADPGPAGEFTLLEGEDAYQAGLGRLRAWCDRYAERWPSDAPLVESLESKEWGPSVRTRHENTHRRGKTMVVDGRLWMFRCLKPWMWKMLETRGEYLSLREKKPEDLFKWYSKVAAIINDPEALPQFLAWLGEENFAYQIRVTGFRSGSEQKGPMDIGLQDYESSTIGAALPELQGTIQSLIQEKRISSDTVMSLLGGLSGTRN
ncbi:MAG TPA: hypothetical protein VM598_02285, partial [Bdellovibrionota bacterium]|nr:hypothetical protein [Bdellovibrionota bacterium]